MTLENVSIVDTLVDAEGNPLALTSGPDFVSADQGSLEGDLLVGETATYTATYVLDQDDVDAGGVSNSVVATGESSGGIEVNDTSDDGDDTDGNDEDDPTETLIIDGFELSIEKSVNDTSPGVGDVVTFTITISNDGIQTATNVVVDEVLPSGYVFVSATPTAGTYSDFDGEWTIPQIDPGTIEILELDAEVLGFGDYLNTATITDFEGGVDGNDDNNSASATLTPDCLIFYNEFSPNDDGVNDTFVIDCIENYPNNKLEIYNRWGNIVYEERGYRNTWKGVSNGRAVLNEVDELPEGTYYYVLDLADGSKPKVGWLYINR